MPILKPVLDELRTILGKAESAGDTVAGDVKALYRKLVGNVPALEAEVKADAEQVVKTAETQGVVPAEHEAEADAVKIGAHVARDAADAARTPQQAAAVIAGEAAVAEPHKGA